MRVSCMSWLSMPYKLYQQHNLAWITYRTAALYLTHRIPKSNTVSVYVKGHIGEILHIEWTKINTKILNGDYLTAIIQSTTFSTSQCYWFPSPNPQPTLLLLCCDLGHVGSSELSQKKFMRSWPPMSPSLTALDFYILVTLGFFRFTKISLEKLTTVWQGKWCNECEGSILPSSFCLAIEWTYNTGFWEVRKTTQLVSLLLNIQQLVQNLGLKL